MPKEPFKGIEKNAFDGVEYREFIKLHVRTYEFTGLMIGVWVDTIDWFVDWIDAGYVCAENPIKLPNALLNVNCGVWFDMG